MAHESRCGVKCLSCERKEAVGCKGCLNMDKTFWGGVCEVKKCCEDKNNDHCGVCGVFPCDMQLQMGVEQGYDPAPRLNMLKLWAAGKN